MANKEQKTGFQAILDLTSKIDKSFNLNEANDKWIQGALGKTEKKPEGKHLGALHSDLGIPKDKKIPMPVINKKIAAIHAKYKNGEKMSAEDRKEMKRLTLAKTLKSESINPTKKIIKEHDEKSDADMIKGQLEDLAKCAGDIHNKLEGKTDLPAWMIEKIATACESLYDVHNALHTEEESEEGMSGIEDQIENDDESVPMDIIRGKFQENNKKSTIAEEEATQYKSWNPNIPWDVVNKLEKFGSTAYRQADNRTGVGYYKLPDGYVVASNSNYALGDFIPVYGGVINNNGKLFNRKGDDITNNVRKEASEYAWISDGLKQFIGI